VVEHAASEEPQEGLGPFLVREGALDPAKLAEAEAAGGDLLSTLASRKLVDPAATFQLLQRHGAGLVWRAMAVEAGSWRWEPGVAPPPSSFPLGSRWGMLCDAVRRLDAAGVRRRLGGRARRAASRSGGRVDVADLKLMPQEARVCGAFDGQRSVEELAAGRPDEAELLLRVTLLLAETELLAFGAERAAPPAPGVPPATAPTASSGAGAPPRPAPPRPAPEPQARPAAKPGSPASAAPPRAPPAGRPAAAPAAASPAPAAAPKPAASLADLRAFHEKLQSADHFQALGVKPEATAAQVKMAYFQLAKTYHPDAGSPEEAAEARKLRSDIFARLGEAWAVLGDDERRVRYLEEMKGGGPANVDVMAILQAEQVFHAATLLVKARKFEEAVKKLDEAIQLNAEEPEFGIWRAWAAFHLVAGEQRSRQVVAASQAIEAGLRLAPRCVSGYLFLGRMAKLAGDAAAAERHFKRGLEVDPGNAELKSELRHARK
jgi:tetratricopeptide (TPR) repeat protein